MFFKFAVRISQVSEISSLTDAATCNSLNQVLSIENWFAVKLSDDVVRLQSCRSCRRGLARNARIDIHHDGALRFRQTINLRKLISDSFERDPEIAASDFPFIDNLFVDKAGLARRQGEANAVVVTRGGRDLGVHANDLSTHVHQRPATIAAIDGGICLQEPLEGVEVRSLAFLFGNDARRNSLLQAEWRTDREHPITNLC